MGHAIAAEPATEVPVREIAFCIESIENNEALDYEETSRRLEPLLIRRNDSGIITVGDVVAGLSSYFIVNEDLILESKAPFLQMPHEVMSDGEHVVGVPAYEDMPVPTDTRVAFQGFFGGVEPGHYALMVELWAEGEEGKTLD